MELRRPPSVLKIFLTVGILVTSQALFGSIQVQSPSSGAGNHPQKSFAVFYAKVDRITGRATGGVAGTAFFISPQRALTARHVLKKESFQPGQATDLVQLWLVRENRPAIPIKPSQVTEVENQDLTVIDFGAVEVANSDEIFQFAKDSEQESLLGNPVDLTTEGFRASSLGPVIRWDGEKLVIDSVPRLERLTKTGRLLRFAKVDLLANDVQLKQTPCLQVQFDPVVGLSGGPLLSKGQIVGLNSFADPARDSTWAVSLADKTQALLAARKKN